MQVRRIPSSRRLGLGALALCTALGASSANAQPGLESYRKARAALDAAVAASGGAERLTAIETVNLEQTGTNHARNQSVEVAAPFGANPQTRRGVLDLKRGWMLQENSGTFTGGFQFAARQYIKDQERINIDLVAKTVQSNEQVQPANFDPIQRLFPPLMLRKVLQRLNTLRWLGENEIDGRKHETISFAWDNGGVYNLYFDAQTHLLTKYELLFPDSLTGDAVAELYFSGYHDVDGMQVPETVRQVYAGDLLNEWKYTKVEINKPIDESLFQAPADYAKIDAAPAPTVEVEELAKDVWLVKNLGPGGGYNLLGVAFQDHLLVVEAPLNAQTSAQAYDLLKAKAPGKPIRYGVLTHHHDDHSGGVRALAVEGATIVTVAANTGYFEKMIAAQPTLTPVRPVSGKPKFELVEGKRVFSDGTRTVEVHDIGPSPHAKNMFIVYLPQERVVFQGDLLFVPKSGPMPPSSPATVHFAQALEKLGLKVDKIAAVHGEVGTMQQLQEAASKQSSASSGQSR